LMKRPRSSKARPASFWRRPRSRRPRPNKPLCVRHMVEWFFENYQDPVHCSPYDNEEGEYVYFGDGPFFAREVIDDNFPGPLAGFSADELEAMIDVAVSKIESWGTHEWAEIPCAGLRCCAHIGTIGRRPHDEARGKTLCGRPLETCPGELGSALEGEITSKVCRRMFAREVKRARGER